MASYPTLHEVRAAADGYWDLWESLLAATPTLRTTIGQHSPTALGWKVEGDVAPLEAAERLFELGDSAFMTAVDGERSILSIRKPKAIALDTLNEIKILQRRPSRPNDKLGPDSLDILVPHGTPRVEDVHAACVKVGAAAVHEHNTAHQWISIRYKDHEFKITDHSVWEVCAREAAAIAGLEIR